MIRSGGGLMKQHRFADPDSKRFRVTFVALGCWSLTRSLTLWDSMA